MAGIDDFELSLVCTFLLPVPPGAMIIQIHSILIFRGLERVFRQRDFGTPVEFASRSLESLFHRSSDFRSLRLPHTRQSCPRCRMFTLSRRVVSTMSAAEA